MQENSPVAAEKPLTLALDQGSNSSRLILFNQSGETQLIDTAPIHTANPATGYYEHNPEEILQSLQNLLNRIKPNLAPLVHSCGLSTQRSTILAWDRQTGQALSQAISWRDLRGQQLVKTLQQQQEEIHSITGLPLSAHYSASKIRYLLDILAEKKHIDNDRLCISPLASYLLFHLSDSRTCVIDHSNAQRTLLFDIHTMEWSDRLLELFDIPREILPQCTPIVNDYGSLKSINASLTAVCGDQNAVVHAFTDSQNDSTIINIGTGAFSLTKTDTPTRDTRMICSIANSNTHQAQFMIEGTVNGAGSALTWAQQQWPQENLFQLLPDWLEETKHQALFINTVSGLGSPWWCQGGEASFINDNSIADKYVAIIESIVFLIHHNLQQLQSKPEQLYISGGLAELDSICQKLANLTQLKTIRSENREATARGCACLANQLSQPDFNWPDISPGEKFNPVSDKPLEARYQQFVGEIKKRCCKY